MPNKGKEVKNGVVTAKCNLRRDECRDPNCPVHGEPQDEGASKSDEDDTQDGPTPALKGVDKLEAAEMAAREAGERGEEIPITAVDETNEKAVWITSRPSECAIRTARWIMERVPKPTLGSDSLDVINVARKIDEAFDGALPIKARSALVDALGIIQHIQHHNDFTTGLIKRIQDILDPPVELYTLEQARERLRLSEQGTRT
jgi:hypothetical protein